MFDASNNSVFNKILSFCGIHCDEEDGVFMYEILWKLKKHIIVNNQEALKGYDEFYDSLFKSGAISFKLNKSQQEFFVAFTLSHYYKYLGKQFMSGNYWLVNRDRNYHHPEWYVAHAANMLYNTTVYPFDHVFKHVRQGPLSFYNKVHEIQILREHWQDAKDLVNDRGKIDEYLDKLITVYDKGHLLSKYEKDPFTTNYVLKNDQDHSRTLIFLGGIHVDDDRQEYRVLNKDYINKVIILRRTQLPDVLRYDLANIAPKNDFLFHERTIEDGLVCKLPYWFEESRLETDLFIELEEGKRYYLRNYKPEVTETRKGRVYTLLKGDFEYEHLHTTMKR
jgi:hypothetical protein